MIANVEQNKDKQIDAVVESLTRSHHHFPWNWYDGIPKAGKTHSYLITMLQPFINQAYREFTNSRPTLRELNRLIDAIEQGQAPEDNLIIHIAGYCENATMLEDYSMENDSVEKEVFMFLVNCNIFMENFREKVRLKYCFDDSVKGEVGG